MKDAKKNHPIFYTEFCKKRHEMWKHEMKQMQIQKRLLRAKKEVAMHRAHWMKCIKMLRAKWYLPKSERERKFRKLDFKAGGKLLNAAVKKNSKEAKEIMWPVQNPHHRKGPWGIVKMHSMVDAIDGKYILELAYHEIMVPKYMKAEKKFLV